MKRKVESFEDLDVYRLAEDLLQGFHGVPYMKPDIGFGGRIRGAY